MRSAGFDSQCNKLAFLGGRGRNIITRYDSQPAEYVTLVETMYLSSSVVSPVVDE
jgi:hypothetical protein